MCAIAEAQMVNCGWCGQDDCPYYRQINDCADFAPTEPARSGALAGSAAAHRPVRIGNYDSPDMVYVESATCPHCNTILGDAINVGCSDCGWRLPEPQNAERQRPDGAGRKP